MVFFDQFHNEQYQSALRVRYIGLYIVILKFMLLIYNYLFIDYCRGEIVTIAYQRSR